MSTSTYPLHPQGYFHNVGRAAASLGAALIAVPARQAQDQAPDATLKYSHAGVSGRAHAEAAELLNSLASEFEATQPNQAAELRWLASRA